MFNPNKYADEYNMFMRDLRSKGEMPGSTGGMTGFPGLFIYAVARQLNATKILEVGTRNGISAATFCRAMNENNKSGLLVSCDVVDVELVGGRPVTPSFKFPLVPSKMIEAVGDGNIETRFLQCKGEDFLDSAIEKYFDIILLDGSHKEPDVIKEVPLALRAVKPGGVVILDDVYPEGKLLKSHGKVIPGPWLALQTLGQEFIRPNPNYSVAYLPCSL